MSDKLGDVAIYSKNFDAAIEYYSGALSLDPPNINNVIVKCCKARAGLLNNELIDATKVWISLHAAPQ
jgi:hypothetical protein